MRNPADRSLGAEDIELFVGKNSRKLLHISILLKNVELTPSELSRLKTRVMDLLGRAEQSQDSGAQDAGSGQIGWDVAKESVKLGIL